MSSTTSQPPKVYRIHAARTGFGTQTRIIVYAPSATPKLTCGVKWDDVLCPNAATASRRLREMRAEYGVSRVTWWPSVSRMDIWS